MFQIYDQATLAKIRTDGKWAAPSDFWRRTFFGGTPYFSRNRKIQFADIATTRKMAPFVFATEMGRPIYGTSGAALKEFEPAYIKLLDAIRPEEARTVTTNEILTGQQISLEERFAIRVVEIVGQHLDSIQRQWDYMCAKAIIDGTGVFKYTNDQGAVVKTVTLDYGRNSAQTVVLASGSKWTDPDISIFDNIQSWIDIGLNADFGGVFDTLIVGKNVVPYLFKNKSILDKLDTNVRGGEGTQFTRGLVRYNQNKNEPTYLGTLGANGTGIAVYTYSDQQIDADGNLVNMLNPNDVVLTAPGVEGTLAFGAIYDLSAFSGGSNSLATDIFQKMYDIENPSQRNILSQSAPLAIPVYPNRTFKATVL